MAGPWEQFQQQAPVQQPPAQASGPWSQFQPAQGLQTNAVPGNSDVPMPNNSPDTVQDTPNPFLEGLKETSRVLDTGIKQGIRGPIEANNFLQNLVGMPQIPHEQWLQDALKAVTPIDNKPETPLGQSAANVLGDVTSSAVLPGGGLASRALQGLAGGTSVEALKANGVTDPRALAAAAIVGGGGALAAKSLITPGARTAALSQEALRDVSPTDLMIAKDAQTEAAKQGVNLTLGQALPTANNAQVVEKVLANTPEGAPLAAQIRAQPQEVANAANTFKDSLPGDIKAPADINQQAQQQATNAIQGVKQWVTSEVKPYFAASGNLAPSHAQALVDQVKGLATSNPGTVKGNLMQTLADNLTVTKPLYKGGEQIGTKDVPLTDIQQINSVLRSAQNSAKNVNLSSAAGDSEATGLLDSVAGGIRGEMGAVSPSFAQGNQLYGALRQSVYNPVKAGPLGDIAGRSGFNGEQTSPDKIMKIFDQGTPIGPNTGSRILTTQSQLARTGDAGKQAFMDAGTTWIANGMDKALSNVGGGVTPNAASSLESQFFGTDAKVQGFKDVLAGIAKSNGTDPKDLVDSGTNLMKTIQRAASGNSGNVGATASDVRSAMTAPIAKAGQFSFAEPLRLPTQWISNFTGANARTTVAKLLQTPEGIDQLKQFAQVTPGSPASIKALIGLNSLVTPSQEEK